MIRKLLAVLLWIIPGLLSAQNNNVIFRLEGEAKVMRRGEDTWNPLKEKDAVMLFDVIDLSPGGSVSIMKTSTRAVYTSVHAGPMMVYDIFKQADAGHMEVVRNVVQEAAQGGGRSDPDFSSYGASVRGQDAGNTAAVYACLCEAVERYFAEGTPGGPEGCVSFARAYDGGTFSFKLVNGGEEAMFVNVVCMDAASSSSCLCYPFPTPIVIMPGTEMTLPGKYCPDASVSYMLLVSAKGFDASLLDLSLKKGLAPECGSGGGCNFVME